MKREREREGIKEKKLKEEETVRKYNCREPLRGLGPKAYDYSCADVSLKFRGQIWRAIKTKPSNVWKLPDDFLPKVTERRLKSS